MPEFRLARCRAVYLDREWETKPQRDWREAHGAARLWFRHVYGVDPATPLYVVEGTDQPAILERGWNVIDGDHH